MMMMNNENHNNDEAQWNIFYCTIIWFQVVRETGPPHMRTFVTKCVVGDIVTEGEGNGKKVNTKDESVNDRYDMW